MPTDSSRFRGVLLGGFVGDALGAPFEGTPVGGLARLADALERRTSAPRHWGYTDDTEMAIGVAESLLDRRTVDPHHLLRTLVDRHDPARGYGKGMKLISRALADGAPWHTVAATAWPDGSRGNGAAARVGPLACLHHADDAALQSAVTAATTITHAHPEAVAGAQLLARAIALLLRGHAVSDLLPDLLEHTTHPEFTRKLHLLTTLDAATPRPAVVAALGHGVLALESVPLALNALVSAPPDLPAIVTHAIRFGGDTDTIGAMAGALAGAALGDQAIPATWLAALENGPRGRDHVLRLADDLFTLADP